VCGLAAHVQSVLLLPIFCESYTHPIYEQSSPASLLPNLKCSRMRLSAFATRLTMRLSFETHTSNGAELAFCSSSGPWPPGCILLATSLTLFWVATTASSVRLSCENNETRVYVDCDTYVNTCDANSNIHVMHMQKKYERIIFTCVFT